MSLELIVYVLYVFANTLIVLLNILVIWAAAKSRELLRNFTLHIVITAIILDIAVYIIIIFHDVPSFALNKDFSTAATKNVFVLILCLQWFAQLLFLPLLSIIHLFAIFSPLKFRNTSHKHFTSANCAVVITALLLTAPLFTKYCGYTYLIPGHYWYFDFAKPYTHFYQHFNQILQIMCGVFVFVSDMCIICRILRLRSLSLRSHSKSGYEKKWKVGREGRIAINFLLLSSCFLIMSVFYNVDLGYGFWQTLVLKISTLLNLSKWAIYVLANTSISKVIREILGFQASRHIPPTTTTVTKF